MMRNKIILTSIFTLISVFSVSLLSASSFTLQFAGKNNVSLKKVVVHNLSRICKDTVISYIPTSGNISFLATVETTSGNISKAQSQALSLKSGQSFCYVHGDSLQYTVYANGYAKTTTSDKPSKNYTYQFQMEVPIVSFAVISDIHFGNSTGIGPMIKVPRALKNLTSKTPLINAIFAVGDLTNNGTAVQYDQFLSVFNNTSNIPASVQKVYMMGNHDNYPADGQTTYQNKLGQPFDQYLEINGLPFITISQRAGSNSGDGKTSYPIESQNYLRNSLIAATRDYPGKPIFVFTHVAPLGTVAGARIGDYGANDGWGMPILTPILKEYPQVILFAGHSHYPIGDPNSINQDKAFTVVNTGSTTYSEIQGGLVDKGIHPEAYNDITEGYIVNVMANGDVILDRWDTFRDEEILPEFRVNAPHDGSQFVYKSSRSGMPKPFFGIDATLTITAQDYSCSVSFPQAMDDDFVQRYTVEIYKGATKVTSYKVFSQFYLNSQMPSTLSASNISGLLPDTEYMVKVFANDCFGNISEPLESFFRTLPGNNDPVNQVPERKGSWLFDDATDLFKASIGQSLIPGTSTGGVAIVYPTDNGNITTIAGPTASNKAVFVPKRSCVKMLHGIAASGGSKVNEYTLMIDFKLSFSHPWYSLIQTELANTDDADIFINASNGKVGLSVAAGGYSAAGAIVANTWCRYVFVVKSGQPIKQYVNGVPIHTGSGNMSVDGRWALETGGLLLFSDNTDEDGDFNIAEIAIWDKNLTPAQIANLGICE